MSNMKHLDAVLTDLDRVFNESKSIWIGPATDTARLRQLGELLYATQQVLDAWQANA